MESVRVTAAAPVSSAHCPSTDTNTFAIQFCFPKESNFKRGSTVPVLACGFQQRNGIVCLSSFFVFDCFQCSPGHRIWFERTRGVHCHWSLAPSEILPSLSATTTAALCLERFTLHDSRGRWGRHGRLEPTRGSGGMGVRLLLQHCVSASRRPTLRRSPLRPPALPLTHPAVPPPLTGPSRSRAWLCVKQHYTDRRSIHRPCPYITAHRRALA